MPEKIVIWDEAMQAISAQIVLAAPLLDIKIRKDFLIAVLERKTVVYEMETLLKKETFDSFDNTKGLCAVS